MCIDPSKPETISKYMDTLNHHHPDFKLQFTKMQFIKFLHVMYGDSIIICDDIIKHFYKKVYSAGYIKDENSSTKS